MFGFGERRPTDGSSPFGEKTPVVRERVREALDRGARPGRVHDAQRIWQAATLTEGGAPRAEPHPYFYRALFANPSNTFLIRCSIAPIGSWNRTI